MKNPLQPSIFAFIDELVKNNNREWFTENKARYDKQKMIVQSFTDSLNDVLSVEDEFGKAKMYRIYRDTRFSLDKTPYKNHYGLIFSRRQPHNRGSFYVHLEPGNSFVGGGFWSPNKEDLLRIRLAIEMEDDLELLLKEATLVKEMGGLKGESVKTAPKGFDKDHPRINLLRYKQFLLTKTFSDDEVISENFIEQVKATYLTMQPFFRYMTDVLTTDANGESLLD